MGPVYRGPRAPANTRANRAQQVAGLVVSSEAAGRELVPVRKAHVTAMCKSVGSSWSSADASVNLSTNPAVDVVLESTAPHAHCVQVSHVLDAHTVECLQTVTVTDRHIVV